MVKVAQPIHECLKLLHAANIACLAHLAVLGWVLQPGRLAPALVCLLVAVSHVCSPLQWPLGNCAHHRLERGQLGAAEQLRGTGDPLLEPTHRCALLSNEHAASQLVHSMMGGRWPQRELVDRVGGFPLLQLSGLPWYAAEYCVQATSVSAACCCCTGLLVEAHGMLVAVLAAGKQVPGSCRPVQAAWPSATSCLVHSCGLRRTAWCCLCWLQASRCPAAAVTLSGVDGPACTASQ